MISQVIVLAAFASLAAASGVAVHAVPAPKPYKFGYNIKDKTSEQYRQEAGNGAGVVAGSYGIADARGIRRQVDYVADNAGFRAAIRTNEPGTANQNPAAVSVVSNAPYAGQVATLGGAGLGYGRVLDGRLAPVDGRVGLLDGRLGYGGYGLGYGGVRDGRLGYGLGYGRYGLGYGGYGLGYRNLGGLGYARYGY